MASSPGFLLRFVITGNFTKVRGTNMAAMSPFLAMYWQVGVGVGGGCPLPLGGPGGLPWESFKILGPNGCILGYFCTLSVLILADTCIMRHSLV